jgi:hypothetical protein
MMSEVRLARDREIASMMVGMYCKSHHRTTDTLCVDCLGLVHYAHARLEKCPHGDDKPMCHECTIHCYKPDMRTRISEVMRAIGPMMAHSRKA